MDTPNKTFFEGLTGSPARDRITANNVWLMCPVCGEAKLARLLPTTEVKDLALYCKHCRKERVVNILPEPEPRA